MYPHNGCSKGGELLATGQLSNSSPNHHPTQSTHIQTNKFCWLLYSFVHQTKGLSFYMLQGCVEICLKTGSQTLVPRADPTYSRANLINFVMYPWQFVPKIWPQPPGAKPIQTNHVVLLSSGFRMTASKYLQLPTGRLVGWGGLSWVVRPTLSLTRQVV